jgi:hypothetical protein
VKKTLIAKDWWTMRLKARCEESIENLIRGTKNFNATTLGKKTLQLNTDSKG